ncbi:indole-3-glycerol phosphate synthase TrpC [Apilactobacillus nanyangensis]|uniref:indole-3-glycerol phosphate synthase TrpC n=1 Tax=Apilactobacillus nanyangensis TaxID=2799579 RepID=UPI0019454851|nr:indole-3-glycerol phosphate synthase TrpC [Apilactobacillus nanyangensis]
MILDDLVEATQARTEHEQSMVSLADLKQSVEKMASINPNDVYERFRRPGMHVIGEIKKASPSKGQIVDTLDYIGIAKQYSEADVTAISVLTEPKYFKGDISYLKEINQTIDAVTLRKDFIINPYMIYQARAAGAKIILLIVAILSKDQLKQYFDLAHELGLAVLVEAHNEEEVATALSIGAQMIGVNNRNLKDFTVSFENSINLRKKVPNDIIFIAESGVKSIEDTKKLQEIGVNGVLIGETLMKSDNPIEFIKKIQGDA